jgi:hypothetical protein
VNEEKRDGNPPQATGTIAVEAPCTFERSRFAADAVACQKEATKKPGDVERRTTMLVQRRDERRKLKRELLNAKLRGQVSQ